MQTVKNAVIAAAGIGSRLGLGMPKCMISINEIPILARMLTLLTPRVETIVIVAGYREDLIIEYCNNHFRDVVIARNPDFATTNTAQSLAIGARLISGKTIFLDGDLLLEKVSLDRFISIANSQEILLGVTPVKTEHPVYADCTENPFGELTIKGFSREPSCEYEWANLFVGPHDIMEGAQHYVFEKLAEKLPVKAALIEVEEIDTPNDMVRAEKALKAWGE
jgi:NDP-sugar pyrophosphorylase family protein